jgi:hypothetical protein
VNEVVLPVNLKDAFNALTPDQDATVMAAVDRVKDPEVPKLIAKIYGIEAPAAPRDDLVAAFLTGIKGLNQPTKPTPSEMLRLNTKTGGVFDAVLRPIECRPNRDVRVRANSGTASFASQPEPCGARIRFVVPASDVLLTLVGTGAFEWQLTYREPR